MVGSRQTKPPTMHYPNTTKVLHIQISLLMIINNSFYKDIIIIIILDSRKPHRPGKRALWIQVSE